MTDHTTLESQPRVLTDHPPLATAEPSTNISNAELHIGQPVNGVLHTGAAARPPGMRRYG